MDKKEPPGLWLIVISGVGWLLLVVIALIAIHLAGSKP